jgi:predicted small secreted protein
MQKILIALAMAMLIFTLSACETMKGLAKDVEDAGEWVQEKAQ